MSRILVIDDEPDQRFLLRRILEGHCGHEVAEASHGGQALESVRRTAPDLVITDMMMPVMGGAELIRRLRSDPRTSSIPILAVTGDSALAAAADVVLPKPYAFDDLVAAVAALLAQKVVSE